MAGFARALTSFGRPVGVPPPCVATPPEDNESVRARIAAQGRQRASERGWRLGSRAIALHLSPRLDPMKKDWHEDTA